GFDVVRCPCAGRELVLDQPVGGRGIRHSQERLRQDHQSEPLFGGERVGVKEVLDTAEPPGPRPNALDEAPRVGIDPPFGLARARGLIEQGGCHHLVGGRIGSAEEWRGVRLANVRIWDHDGSQGPASLRTLMLTAVHVIGRRITRVRAQSGRVRCLKSVKDLRKARSRLALWSVMFFIWPPQPQFTAGRGGGRRGGGGQGAPPPAPHKNAPPSLPGPPLPPPPPPRLP